MEQKSQKGKTARKTLLPRKNISDRNSTIGLQNTRCHMPRRKILRWGMLVVVIGLFVAFNLMMLLNYFTNIIQEEDSGTTNYSNFNYEIKKDTRPTEVTKETNILDSETRAEQTNGIGINNWELSYSTRTKMQIEIGETIIPTVKADKTIEGVTANSLSNLTANVLPEIENLSTNTPCPDLIAQLKIPGFCHTVLAGTQRCLMSINSSGRLGNQMGQYATLYALAKWNQRPAFILPGMAQILQKYFEVSMPVLDKTQATCIGQHWKEIKLNDWMDDYYRSINIDSLQPVMLTGFPSSWTFYHHIRAEILREFNLLAPIKERAQRKLHILKEQRPLATFIGVHVRRGDYVDLMATQFRGVVADAHFFAQATEYFRHRYHNAIFVVASDDMEWCRKNINNSLDDVHFLGEGNISDPIEDFALLSQCNHSIITIGTYGYWAAYLAGGDTVYLSNYTLPDSEFLSFFSYAAAYLPSWIPIAANLSVLTSQETSLTTTTNK